MTTRKGRNTVEIVGIRIDSTSAREVLSGIEHRLRARKKTFIVTPNPEFIVFSQTQTWFKKILSQADLAIPDGIGLLLAAQYLKETEKYRLPLIVAIPLYMVIGFRIGLLSLLKRNYFDALPERVSGTDLMERLCREAAKQSWSVYLLGSQPGVAKKTLKILKKRYSGLRGWAESGPELELKDSPVTGLPAGGNFPEWRRKEEQLEVETMNNSEGSSRTGRVGTTVHWSTSEVKKWIRKVNQKKPDILFVALGMGKQEKFIWENWDQLKVKVAMGVGGAFDYLSGKIPRAPLWIRKVGLEWVYRLWQEPIRLRRILTALVYFPLLVVLDSFKNEGIPSVGTPGVSS